MFYHLLSSSISFVMFLMMNIYKSHSSPPLSPTLVYLVLLAPIDPLVTSPRLQQVFALLLSRHFILETLNLWSSSVWAVTLKSLQCPPVFLLQEEPLILQGLHSSLPGSSVTIMFWLHLLHTGHCCATLMSLKACHLIMRMGYMLGLLSSSE